MFEVIGPIILSNGIAWCPWLTQMLTPAMLYDLVGELNEALNEAENMGYENGHSDGYSEGEDYAHSMIEEYANKE